MRVLEEIMGQVIVRYYRLFGEQERSKGLDCVLSLQNFLVALNFLSARRYESRQTSHVIFAYAALSESFLTRSVITLHQFGNPATPKILSVVVGMSPEADPEILTSLELFLFEKGFKRESIETRAIEVMSPGCHELIAPWSSSEVVEASLCPSPRATPASGTDRGGALS